MSKEIDERPIVLTVAIISAYVSNNALPAAQVPALIVNIYNALAISKGRTLPASVKMSPPAVPIGESICDEYLICLEDGRRFKTLKQHLRVRYNMTAAEYRAKWQLPGDYPMVAPNFSASRSKVAKSLGFGHQRGKREKLKNAPEQYSPPSIY